MAGLLVVILHASGAAAAPSPARAARTDEPAPIPTREEREAFRKQHRSPGSLAAEAGSPLLEGAAAGADAIHYTLDLRFDSGAKTVTGTVTGTYQSLSPGLTTLVLDLYDNMTVTSVTLGGSPLPYSRGSNRLTITLDRPYAVSETFQVAVAYTGSPQNLGFGSFPWQKHNGKPIFWSLSEPTYGPTWWPSIDDPADKVVADMIFTVEPNLVAVSNGLLQSTTALPGGWTAYHWVTTYPTSPYLLSVAATNYASFAHPYTPLAGGSPMEIRYWVYPEILSEAQASFAVTPYMLGVFAGLFGEYPFLAEKYAMATVGFSGGMEHQTATSYGAGIVTGTNAYEWLIAHEMAHQWWGDSLTLGDWRETWTHEGFATYAEALYFEVKNGRAYYHTYMNGLDPGSFNGPVYDNPGPFSSTVYDKGAWVLHMLRRVMGDAAFFDLLFDYHDQHRFGTISTEIFRAAAEAAYGDDLSWFFQEWVYGSGRPAYQWGWTVADTGGGHVAHVRIDQSQAGSPYRMPLDLRFVTPSGTVDAVVWSDGVQRDFAIPVPAPPTSVLLDPDNWVLNSATIVALADGDADGVPNTADNCGALANPDQADTDRDGAGDACDPDADGDGAANGADCAWLDGGSFAAPYEILDAAMDETTLSWTSQAPLSGAATSYDVVRGDALTLTLLPGLGDASCFAAGYPAAAIGHGSDPPPDGVFYYLVRARNVCGIGSWGDDSIPAPRVVLACP